MGKRIKTGIIGLGRAGWGLHAEPIGQNDDYEIVAVAEPLEERRKEAAEKYGCKTFENIEDVLKKSDTDLIVVATQSMDHAKHSVMALEAGKHVLVEKPFAMNLKEADETLAAAKKSGKVFTVNQSRRLNPEFVHVQKLVEGDERLGDVFYVKDISGSFARRWDWQTLRKYGGGTLNNTAVHGLDGCYLLMGAPVKDVWGDLQKINSLGDAEDHVKVLMRGTNGRVIDFEVSSASALPAGPRWMIYGTRGTAAIQDGKTKIKYYEKDALPSLEVLDKGWVDGRKYLREEIPWKEEEMEAKADPGKKFHERLADTILRGAPVFVDPKSCRDVLEILLKARIGTGFPPNE